MSVTRSSDHPATGGVEGSEGYAQSSLEHFKALPEQQLA
jgi:hypothetical protein